MKDRNATEDRKEIADNIREILVAWPDRGYCRAFARCVISNFRSGLTCVPKQDASGRWFPVGPYQYRKFRSVSR